MDELTERSLFDGPKLLRRLLLKYPFGFGISKRLYHGFIVYRYSVNCKADGSSCQGKVEMSPSQQSRNVPIAPALWGTHVMLLVPVKRKRAMLASNPIEE
jgi:hypothetical protein